MVYCNVLRHPAIGYGWVPCPSRAQRRLCASSCSAVAADAFDFPGDGSTDAETNGPKHRSDAAIRVSKLRAILFFTFSMGLAVPLFLFMSVIYPAVMLLDRYRRRAEHLANNIWAVLSTAPFVKVKVPLSKPPHCLTHCSSAPCTYTCLICDRGLLADGGIGQHTCRRCSCSLCCQPRELYGVSSFSHGEISLVVIVLWSRIALRIGMHPPIVVVRTQRCALATSASLTNRNVPSQPQTYNKTKPSD